jgi:hypothetical protein
MEYAIPLVATAAYVVGTVAALALIAAAATLLAASLAVARAEDVGGPSPNR